MIRKECIQAESYVFILFGIFEYFEEVVVEAQPMTVLGRLGMNEFEFAGCAYCGRRDRMGWDGMVGW